LGAESRGLRRPFKWASPRTRAKETRVRMGALKKETREVALRKLGAKAQNDLGEADRTGVPASLRVETTAIKWDFQLRMRIYMSIFMHA
jgi:hypothetical protein